MLNIYADIGTVDKENIWKNIVYKLKFNLTPRGLLLKPDKLSIVHIIMASAVKLLD